MRRIARLVGAAWPLFLVAFMVSVAQAIGWHRVGAGVEIGVRLAPRIVVRGASLVWPFLVAVVGAVLLQRRQARGASEPSARERRGAAGSTGRAPGGDAPGGALMTGLLAMVATALVVACLFVLPSLLVPSPPARVSGATDKEQVQFQNDRLKARNDARAGLLQGVGGLVLLTGAYFTWRQIRLTHEGQYNERLKNAIEQLGSDSVDSRVPASISSAELSPGPERTGR
jgi:hypothetical protein